VSGNDAFKRALAAKVKMVFGTDATAGAHGRNAEELVYRVKEGGQAPMDAIVTATSRRRNRCGWAIKSYDCAGMQADIIATDGTRCRTSPREARDVRHEGGKVFNTKCRQGRSRHRRGRPTKTAPINTTWRTRVRRRCAVALQALLARRRLRGERDIADRRLRVA